MGVPVQGGARGAAGSAVGGAVLAALGVAFVAGGVDLGLGSPLRLGTGAFPFITGALLLALAVAIVVHDVKGRARADAPDWISMLAIGAALVTFAATAERHGLVPATFLTVVVASAPERSLSWPARLALGAGVALGGWLLFIEALGLPFKAIAGA